jgi:hypothetical protein
LVAGPAGRWGRFMWGGAVRVMYSFTAREMAW